MIVKNKKRFILFLYYCCLMEGKLRYINVLNKLCYIFGFMFG